MKTKLTLFVAVLAFCFQQSLSGAEELVISNLGLEGFAGNGTFVLVHKHPNQDDNKIKGQLENRLKKAGIRINQKARNYLWINVDPIKINGKVVKYFILSEAFRDVMYSSAGDKKLKARGSMWTCAIKVNPADSNKGIDSIANRFIADFLKSNAKK